MLFVRGIRVTAGVTGSLLILWSALHTEDPALAPVLVASLGSGLGVLAAGRQWFMTVAMIIPVLIGFFCVMNDAGWSLSGIWAYGGILVVPLFFVASAPLCFLGWVLYIALERTADPNPGDWKLFP